MPRASFGKVTYLEHSHPRRVRFGPFELDTHTGELCRDGIRVPLQRQPAELLVLLVKNHGRELSRSDIRDHLWSHGELIDWDRSLNSAVRKLRRALGDDPDEPRYVLTLPRRGYRFVAELEYAEVFDAALDDSSDEPRCIETVAHRGYRFLQTVEWQGPEADGTPPRRGISRRVVWISTVAVVTFVAIAAGVAYVRQPTARGPSRIDSIGVLPFAVSDPAIEYLGSGLAETLIDELATSPGLRVAPRSSTFRYGDRVPDPRIIGEQLGLGAIVTGAVGGKDPDVHELQTEMIDAADGSLMWSKRYRVRAADLPVLRRQIAFDISYRLGVARADPALRRSDSSPAWDLYLRGRYLWNRRGRDNVLQAVKAFEQSVQVDPDFALGYAGLAMAYGVMYGNNYLPGSGKEMAEKSKAAVDRALELDDTLAEAYASRAAGYSTYFWDFDAAERDFRRAIELRPGYAPAHVWYGHHLIRVGRLDEARREIELAHVLEPFSRPMNSMMCLLPLWERRYEDAIEFSRRTARIDITLVNPWCFFECEALAGRYEDAIAIVRTAPRGLDPSHADALEAAYREDGPAAFWAKRAEQVSEVDPYTAAQYYAMAADRESAFAKLDIAYQLHTPQLPDLLSDPMFDNLRSDPRFMELARNIGLPQVMSDGGSSGSEPQSELTGGDSLPSRGI